MNDFFNEFLRSKKFILLCVLFVIGILLIVIGINGLISIKKQQVKDLLSKEISPKLPPSIELKYKDVKINLFTGQAVILHLAIYNKATKQNELVIRKVTVKASGRKDNIPLSGKLYLEGISTGQENIQQALQAKSNPKTYRFMDDYFSGSELSMYTSYSFDTKRNILHIKRFSIEYGDKIEFNSTLSLGNITVEDIQKVIKSKDKGITLRAVLMQSRPLSSDFLLNFDFDKINIKELLSAMDISQKEIKAAYTTAKFPEYFNIMFKQHISTDYKKMYLNLDELSFGFEPGLIISLEFELHNINYENPNDFSKIELHKIKFQLKDKNGFNTAYRIISDMRGTPEDQLKTEFKKNINGMVQMYDLNTLLGDKVSLLEDFLLAKKDKLTIRNKKNNIIKIQQFLSKGPSALAELFQNDLVIE